MRQPPNGRLISRYSERTAERLLEGIGPLPSVENHRRIAVSPPAPPSLEFHSKRLPNRVFSSKKRHFPAVKRLKTGPRCLPIGVIIYLTNDEFFDTLILLWKTNSQPSLMQSDTSLMSKPALIPLPRCAGLMVHTALPA